MNKHDYRTEILNILALNENCVLGFNELRRKSSGKKLNPNFLKKYLDKLEVEGVIQRKKIGNRTEIRKVDLNFEKEFSKFTKDLDRLELRVTRQNLSDEQKFFQIYKYLSLALQKNNEIILGMLASVHLDPNKNRIKINKKASQKLLFSMSKTFRLLKQEQKKPMLDYLWYLNLNALDEKNSQMIKKFS